MPTEYHLFQNLENINEHTLEVDFMHCYDKSLTEDYTVRVILPEGASNIRVSLPFEVDDIKIGRFYGTLDYFGRPEITIKKKDAIHDLYDNVLKVHYTYNNSVDFYLEPICMWSLIFSCFLVAIIYTRIGFNLEKNEEKKVVIEEEETASPSKKNE